MKILYEDNHLIDDSPKNLAFIDGQNLYLGTTMIGKKKGNVDSDIIFSVMKMLFRNEIEGEVVLVSGDGDFKTLVDFLIEENKLEKILFPNQARASSLYKKIYLKYRADLSSEGVRNKIEKKKRAP